MFTRHFFVRGTYLATDNPPWLEVYGNHAPPYGKAFLCPLCAEVWAVALVDGQPTHAEHAFCDKHSQQEPWKGDWSFGHIYSWDTPGSLWRTYDMAWNTSLPREVLKREFLLLMDALIMNYPDQPSTTLEPSNV